MAQAKREGNRRNRGPAAAAENRVALLAAAQELFDSRGLDVPLSAIAQHAGVGQGSLYRHFPNRRSLAVAVFEENVQEFERLGADGDATVEDMLRLLTEHAVRSAAFVQLVLAGPRDPQLSSLADRVTAVVVRRASAGSPLFASPDDLLLSVGMVASVVATAPPDQRSEVAHQAWRLLGVNL